MNDTMPTSWDEDHGTTAPLGHFEHHHNMEPTHQFLGFLVKKKIYILFLFKLRWLLRDVGTQKRRMEPSNRISQVDFVFAFRNCTLPQQRESA